MKRSSYEIKYMKNNLIWTASRMCLFLQQVLFQKLVTTFDYLNVQLQLVHVLTMTCRVYLIVPLLLIVHDICCCLLS